MKHVTHRRRKEIVQASLVSLSAVFMWYALSTATPDSLVYSAQSLLANSVGATAAVPENPYNSAAKQLLDKEAELQAREADVARGETALAIRENTHALALASFFMSFLLLTLVAGNFFMDWRRVQLLAKV